VSARPGSVGRCRSIVVHVSDLALTSLSLRPPPSPPRSFVVEHGVGAFEPKPAAAAARIASWLASGRAELERMAAAARALGRPDALIDIVRDLVDLLAQPAAGAGTGGKPLLCG
jgi:hypothetical protein